MSLSLNPLSISSISPSAPAAAAAAVETGCSSSSTQISAESEAPLLPPFLRTLPSLLPHLLRFQIPASSYLAAAASSSYAPRSGCSQRRPLSDSRSAYPPARPTQEKAQNATGGTSPAPSTRHGRTKGRTERVVDGSERYVER